MKITFVFHRVIFTALICMLCLTNTSTARAEEVKTLAVLPFTMNAAEDLTHIQNGIIYMLYSRLSWQDHVVVIPKRQLQDQLLKLKTTKGDELIGKIAARTNSDYVLSGSITKLAGSFSIDTQFYDIKNKRLMAFFEQSKISDELIEKVDRIAATINKEAFNRSTLTLERMEREKQAHINQLKRQNPERLMNVTPGQQESGPGWKLWEYIF
jgi:TolB-like protein